MSLKRALLLLIVTVLAAGLLPAGALLQRRLGSALEERARLDLAAAPMVLDDRMASTGDARMMHAREVARMPGLAEALVRQQGELALRIVTEASRAFDESPVLVGPGGDVLEAPLDLPADLIDATRRGEMPVRVLGHEAELHLVALAPVMAGGEWSGAAGGSTPFGGDEVAALAGLTRSDVLLLDAAGNVVAGSMPDSVAAAVAGAVRRVDARRVGEVVDVGAVGRSFLAVRAPLDGGAVVFLRDLDAELAVLPALRRTAVASAGTALLFALVVGVLVAVALARPVAALAAAADRFAAGDEGAPLIRSRVTEVQRVADAFAAMRDRLAARLDELERANRQLEDRQEKLALLQAELVQRERVSATARLLTQLAHEIRNPVASVRNCLEVVRRSGDLRDEARVFADMAVDELLRMHELAESMLDLHRPRSPAEGGCDLGEVARETAQLARAGAGDAGAAISVVGGAGLRVGMPADALKQVLLNLLLNAREVAEGAPIEVVVSREDDGARLEVLDRGPGIAVEALPRIFDPFFSTKDHVHGVGLGLFTAEGLVRTHGGRISAGNRTDGPGARFVIHLPAESFAAADDRPARPPASTVHD
jgi:signal transduction histidine kinase